MNSNVNKNSGIYCIENLVNGKKYIGQAFYLKNRKSRHFCQLKGNCHHNQHLQRAFNKYGEESFYFYIIEYCEKEDLSEKEIKYIYIFDTHYNGYNMTLGGEGTFGWHPSEETRKKISESQTGQKRSEDHRNNISTSLLMYWNTDNGKMDKERRSNLMSGDGNPMYGLRGKDNPNYGQDKPSISGKNHPFYGTHRSEKTKRKISEALSGENNHMWGKHHSEATKEKIRVGNMGKFVSEETRRKLSNINSGENNPMYGKHLSEEVREKISLSLSGVNCYRSKLTEEQVFEILNLRHNKNFMLKDIAEKYDMGKASISKICLGKTYKLCYKEFMERQ